MQSTIATSHSWTYLKIKAKHGQTGIVKMQSYPFSNQNQAIEHILKLGPKYPSSVVYSRQNTLLHAWGVQGYRCTRIWEEELIRLSSSYLFLILRFGLINPMFFLQKYAIMATISMNLLSTTRSFQFSNHAICSKLPYLAKPNIFKLRFHTPNVLFDSLQTHHASLFCKSISPQSYLLFSMQKS